jgi:phosphoribosylglycinamide formyltransferase 1
MPEAPGRLHAKRRAAVLISGRGSNLQALIASRAAPGAHAEIALVMSNRPEAPGLQHARAVGITCEVVDHRVGSRAEFEENLSSVLQAYEIEIICLAGFMRVLGADFVLRWHDRLLNIHPSLLPAFPGLDSHRRALAAGVRWHGCTVHFVRAEVDAGPIIVQGVVPVRPDDTEERLAARVLAVEHRCYPLALELVASGRARVADERVVIDGAAAPDQALINPLADVVA